eukprot:TRINITY_DN90900_c0_g1_i1.p1 TRINITY_DN90900_c0_g1~~TRINITY_DN90900_c0_g1_i1.p1  ORF type:complete len:549 (-),score=117.20 TRINITY_DN90900_c0_g1_i1:426-2072(-)
MVRPVPKVDRERLKHDHEYLIMTVCQQMRAVDKYSWGLITAANFTEALDSLGLKYGEPEVDDVLQYLTMTDDGYVHYKELQRIVAPSTPRAKRTNAAGTIWPKNEGIVKLQRPYGLDGMQREGLKQDVAFIGDVTREIRDLYVKWSHNSLSNEELKADIRHMGLKITPEFEFRLDHYEGSRQMPYQKFMNALQVAETDARRGRGRAAPPTPVSSLGDEPSRLSGTGETGRSKLRQATEQFVKSNSSAASFTRQLKAWGIHVSCSLERLIRLHEETGSLRYEDFTKLLLPDETANKPRGRGQTSRSRKAGGRDVASNGSTPCTERSSRCSSAPSLRRDDRQRSQGGGRRTRGGRRASSSTASLASSSAVSSSGSCTSRGQRRQGGKSSSRPEATGGGGAVRPPWAMSNETPVYQRSPKQKSVSKAQGDHGKIIGWDGNVPEDLLPLQRRQFREVDDCFNWDTSGRRRDIVSEEQENTRFGKRMYGHPPAAGDFAPFGRASDLGPDILEKMELDVPFGTSRDMGYRRAEDAGTEEFRCHPLRLQGMRNCA